MRGTITHCDSPLLIEIGNPCLHRQLCVTVRPKRIWGRTVQAWSSHERNDERVRKRTGLFNDGWANPRHPNQKKQISQGRVRNLHKAKWTRLCEPGGSNMLATSQMPRSPLKLLPLKPQSCGEPCYLHSRGDTELIPSGLVEALQHGAIHPAVLRLFSHSW